MIFYFQVSLSDDINGDFNPEDQIRNGEDALDDYEDDPFEEDDEEDDNDRDQERHHANEDFIVKTETRSAALEYARRRIPSPHPVNSAGSGGRR